MIKRHRIRNSNGKQGVWEEVISECVDGKIDQRSVQRVALRVSIADDYLNISLNGYVISSTRRPKLPNFNYYF